MSKLKFVLIGTGNIARTYVEATKKVDCAEIAGVISRDIKRAEKYAAENGIPYSADSLSKINCDFDGVFIATPNGLHYLACEEAASLGKHVLTEKPLDITVEHMDCMINACKKADVKLGTTYQYRMRPDNITIKKMLDENKFGKIYAVDLTLKFYRGQDYYDSADWRGTWKIDGGGPFMQQGSHNIDILYWFLGMPEKVFAKASTFAHTGIEVEDHGIAFLEFAEGAIGTITASTLAKPGFSPKLEVFTERGTFVMENDCIVLWDIDGIDNPAAPVKKAMHSAAKSAAVADTSGHEAIIKDFVDAINNNTVPAVSGEDARHATEIILAIYRSAREGKEIIL